MSAGRVPTPCGYRIFVYGLLAVHQYEQPGAFDFPLQLPADEPLRAVSSAADVLSNLSQFAGVVLAPKRAQTFHQIEFIRLSGRRVLLIIVTPDGDVQNRILFVPREYKESELIEASNFFNEHFSGRSFDEVRARLSGQLSSLREDITDRKSTRLNSSHVAISYAVFCLKKKKHE